MSFVANACPASLVSLNHMPLSCVRIISNYCELTLGDYHLTRNRDPDFNIIAFGKVKLDKFVFNGISLMQDFSKFFQPYSDEKSYYEMLEKRITFFIANIVSCDLTLCGIKKETCISLAELFTNRISLINHMINDSNFTTRRYQDYAGKHYLGFNTMYPHPVETKLGPYLNNKMLLHDSAQHLFDMLDRYNLESFSFEELEKISNIIASLNINFKIERKKCPPSTTSRSCVIL